MQYIQGNNRNQTYFASLEDQVSADNPVRLIDAFIDKLDLQKLGQYSRRLQRPNCTKPFVVRSPFFSMSLNTVSNKKQ